MPRKVPLFSAKKISDELQGSSVLITGGSGLVGLGILKFLCYLEDEHGVQATITLTAKTSVGLKLAEAYAGRFSFVQGDLLDSGFLDSLPDFDFVIHAAGYGQPGKFLADPWTTLHLNSLSLMRLRQKANKGFLFLSTSEVYSGIDEEMISEEQIGTTNTLHPRASYIEAKRFGEVATFAPTPDQRPKGVVARLSLAYGPGARLNDERVLNELVIRGLREGKLELKDSGDRTRTYCYIDDAAEMLVGAMVLGRGSVFNISGQSQTSIRELGSLVADKLGISFSVPDAVQEYKDSSPRNVSLSNHKITSLLGKTDFVQLDEGLDHTIAWFNEKLRLEEK
jgi:nucleoside-diphosphate-sugar epimerase